MKKYLATLLLALLVSFSFAQAQQSNEQSRKYYCEIKCYEKGLKSNKKVIFDFGKTISKDIWNCSNHKLRFVDENGKRMKFRSIVDAANFLEEKGWTLQKAYSSTYTNKKSVKHYIFYKEAEGYDEIKEGLITRKQYKRMKKEASKQE